MEKRIYSIGISFLIEIEAESAIEAQDEAIDILRWKMHEHEAKYLQLRVTAAKKIIPPATLPRPEEIAEKLANAASVGVPEGPESGPLVKDDITF